MFNRPSLYMVSLSAISVTFDPIYYMENSGNKQITSFKLHIILSCMIKSHVFLLYPAQYVTHSFVQSIHALYATCPLVT